MYSELTSKKSGTPEICKVIDVKVETSTMIITFWDKNQVNKSKAN